MLNESVDGECRVETSSSFRIAEVVDNIYIPALLHPVSQIVRKPKNEREWEENGYLVGRGCYLVSLHLLPSAHLLRPETWQSSLSHV